MRPINKWKLNDWSIAARAASIYHVIERKVYPLEGHCVQNRSMVPWKKVGKILGRSAPAIAASFLLVCPAGAFCQQSSPSSGNGSSSANSQSQSTAPANKNAFPLAQSEEAAKAATQQGQPSASQPNGKKNGKSSTARDNPFPEAQSKAAAKTDSGSTQPSGAAQGNASSSSSGYSSSDAHLPASDRGQGDFTANPKMDTFTRDQTEDGRIEDDLKTADLYMKNGNYRGAYLRYQDTLQYDPQNDTALYGVADAMCKQNMTAESMAHFKSYAKNNPQGKYAVKAEKMLAHPNKCMHNW